MQTDSFSDPPRKNPTWPITNKHSFWDYQKRGKSHKSPYSSTLCFNWAPPHCLSSAVLHARVSSCPCGGFSNFCLFCSALGEFFHHPCCWPPPSWDTSRLVAPPIQSGHPTSLSWYLSHCMIRIQYRCLHSLYGAYLPHMMDLPGQERVRTKTYKSSLSREHTVHPLLPKGEMESGPKTSGRQKAQSQP